MLGKDWKRRSIGKLLEWSKHRLQFLEQGCVLIECSEKWLDFVCVWKVEPIGRGREELIMIQSFCPERWKEEILDGYVKTVRRIDLEGEVRNSVLDILSLRCLLGSRDESAVQLYKVVTIIVPLAQYGKVNFCLFTQEVTEAGFEHRHSGATAPDFRH